MRRRLRRGSRARARSHGSNGRTADDVAAVPARTAARLGAHRYLQRNGQDFDRAWRWLWPRPDLRKDDVWRFGRALIFHAGSTEPPADPAASVRPDRYQ